MRLMWTRVTDPIKILGRSLFLVIYYFRLCLSEARLTSFLLIPLYYIYVNRIKHTYILDDPFDDPSQLSELIPAASPEGKPKDEVISSSSCYI